MPTSPPPRCTPRSPTNTSGESTNRRIRALASPSASRIAWSRLRLAGAALLLLAFASCGGDSSPPPTATPVTPTPPPPSTGSDEPAERDLVDLAQRYLGLADAPRATVLPAPALGDVQEFHLVSLPASEDATPGRETRAFVLREISEHGYFFVEEGADVTDGAVTEAARVFEERVWPAVTDVFGEPPTPGVDGDPRIAIVHADLGDAVGGYVNGEDAYVTAVAPYSNQREAIYMNLSIPLGTEAYAAILAHELQHLAHEELDRGEDSWVNEGLSEVAASLVGGGQGTYGAFLDEPDTQLNDWGSIGSSAAHYDASSLFFAYLLEQTGGSGGDVASQPGDGLEGVEEYLAETGEARTLEELVADWAVANELDQPEGPYGYGTLEVSEPASEPLAARGVPAEAAVHQFAAD